MQLQEVIKIAEEKDKKLEVGKDFLGQVKVKHRDGSKFNLRFTSHEIIEMHLVVYTEHNGIQYFHCEDLVYAKAAKLNKKLL